MQDREKLFPIIKTFSGSSVLPEPLQTNDNADSRAMPQILVFNAFTVMVLSILAKHFDAEYCIV